MLISYTDKVKLILSVYSILNLLPSNSRKVSIFLRPLDAPRYTEFAYMDKFIRQNNLANMKVLDISSPYLMSYVLSKKNNVIKTDIDSSEKNFIKENKNLSFKIEDGTRLSFADNAFDLVYSVSVIEHIYGKYIQAIQEMIRVTNDDGYIYLTFPVSKKNIEEWSQGAVYEKQYKDNKGTFFQYRFDEEHVNNILNNLSGIKIIQKDIFWERKDGQYEGLIRKITKKFSNKYLTFVKDIAVNYWYGFKLFSKYSSKDFKDSRLFGNIHLILQKDKKN